MIDTFLNEKYLCFSDKYFFVFEEISYGNGKQLVLLKKHTNVVLINCKFFGQSKCDKTILVPYKNITSPTV